MARRGCQLRTMGAAVVLVVLGGCGKAAPTTTPTAPKTARQTGHIVLGSASFEPGGQGWGTSRPTSIFNGGDPSGLVVHIRWTGWGSPVALGRGLNSIFMPHGGYYLRRVTIELRADQLGGCTPNGQRAYRRLSIRVPARPGGKLGPWMLWSDRGTIC